MNQLAEIGRRRTILIAISILLISIHTIYFYQSSRPEIEVKKLIQQIIRFSLTLGLLFLIYNGKKWARIVAIILFSLAILLALYTFFTIDAAFINKTPFIVMIVIYSIAIYHFAFSKSFKEFIKVQNNVI